MSTAGAKVTVSGVRAAPGELRWTLTTPSRSLALWIETDPAFVPGVDGVVPSALLAAMTEAETLTLEAPIDPVLGANLPAIQRWFVAHGESFDWPRRPREVAVESEVRVSGSGQGPYPGRRVGAFFSGGVDSLYTALEAPDLDDLVFIGGFDRPHDRPDLLQLANAAAERAADRLGLGIHGVTTNVRAVFWGVMPWDATYGAALASVALATAPAFRRLYISSGPPDAGGNADGSSRELDPLWGGGALETVRFGGEATRDRKLARVAASEPARSSLRICLDQEATGNCGRCKKCQRAIVLLEGLGVRQRFPTLPAALDLDAAWELDPGDPSESNYVSPAFAAAIREHPNPELVRAYERLFAGRGLPPPAPHDPRWG